VTLKSKLKSILEKNKVSQMDSERLIFLYLSWDHEEINILLQSMVSSKERLLRIIRAPEAFSSS
jgi:hypothetical protein